MKSADHKLRNVGGNCIMGLRYGAKQNTRSVQYQSRGQILQQLPVVRTDAALLQGAILVQMLTSNAEEGRRRP